MRKNSGKRNRLVHVKERKLEKERKTSCGAQHGTPKKGKITSENCWERGRQTLKRKKNRLAGRITNARGKEMGNRPAWKKKEIRGHLESQGKIAFTVKGGLASEIPEKV